MKINNPNKLSSRKRLEDIMNTPDHGVSNIFAMVDEHNRRFNDNLTQYITVRWIPKVEYIDVNINLGRYGILDHESK